MSEQQEAEMFMRKDVTMEEMMDAAGIRRDMSWPTWEQVMQGELSPLRRILIQAIASLSTHPGFASLTPWQTYEKVVQWAQAIEAQDKYYSHE